MPPEFSKKTKENLAKRTAFYCSNPECRVLTTGPSKNSDKSVTVGEAAHIFGARVGSARYRHDMSDGGRAAISNGVWVCRNCHKLIDSDPERYPSEMLFVWRKNGEAIASKNLGKTNDSLRVEGAEKRFEKILGDNSLAMQIATDKSDYWEFRLASELLRDRLKPAVQRWKDFNNNLYVRRMTQVSEEEIFSWVQIKMKEARGFIEPLTKLYTEQLVRAFGDLGEPGSVEEIEHVCSLIGNAGMEIVRWEEDVKFAWVPEDFVPLKKRIAGATGHQLQALMEVSDVLDDGVDQAQASRGELTVIKHTIVFDLPDGWEEGTAAEIDRLRDLLGLELR